MSKFLKVLTGAALLTASAAHAEFGLGRDATPDEVAAWNIDIRPDGQGLPEGSGDVYTGEELWLGRGRDWIRRGNRSARELTSHDRNRT